MTTNVNVTLHMAQTRYNASATYETMNAAALDWVQRSLAGRKALLAEWKRETRRNPVAAVGVVMVDTFQLSF